VPIWRSQQERGAVCEMADRIYKNLVSAGVRVKLDDRDDQTPGFKFNDWEMRGVPIRVEIGPRDIQQNAVVLARRDQLGKESKQFGVPVNGIVEHVKALLDAIQTNLLQQAIDFREANTYRVTSYDQFKEVLYDRGGFLRVHWAGSSEDEDHIKEETKATIRCLPMDTPEGEGACFYTGQKTKQVAIFARAY
jgi:prolyl-tRNA synthetase